MSALTGETAELSTGSKSVAMRAMGSVGRRTVGTGSRRSVETKTQSCSATDNSILRGHAASCSGSNGSNGDQSVMEQLANAGFTVSKQEESVVMKAKQTKKVSLQDDVRSAAEV